MSSSTQLIFPLPHFMQPMTYQEVRQRVAGLHAFLRGSRLVVSRIVRVWIGDQRDERWFNHYRERRTGLGDMDRGILTWGLRHGDFSMVLMDHHDGDKPAWCYQDPQGLFIRRNAPMDLYLFRQPE